MGSTSVVGISENVAEALAGEVIGIREAKQSVKGVRVVFAQDDLLRSALLMYKSQT
jgi:hypothetical protein